MRIIPAIDIIDGKCVRLSKGITIPKLYITKTAVAKEFEDTD
jgi:phosphoribosylformimino-5-aminoimidazole carboxamide ribonucleotide (ProFAR) isomerase